LANAAYHGLAGDFVRAIEPHTEADPVALLIQTLIMFGNVIGRAAHYCVEGDTHYFNEFAVLLGRTAKARKGTSWSRTRRFVERSDTGWGKERIQTGLSSGEGLMHAVRDPVTGRQPIKQRGGRITGYQDVELDPGVADKRLMIYEPEYAVVLRMVERQGNTLSAILRQAWESGTLRTLTKQTPTRATDAHVSLIGHCTIEELKRYLTATETANGLGNRHLWLCVRRSKFLPDGGRVDQGTLDKLQERLTTAVAFGRTVGEMHRDADARTIWHDVYPDLSEGRPGMAGALLARAEAHVIRLACLYACLDMSETIRAPHLAAALALWDYCEQSVRYVFGDSTGDPVADAILRALRIHSADGLSRTEISTLFDRNESRQRIAQALALLLEARLARHEPQQSGGRPTERWYALGQ
jgi:hypothetical protein